MTVNELKNAIEIQLQAGGCETPAFDALCLLEDVGGIGRGKVGMSLSVELPHDRCQAVLEAAKRRASGEPLQYILGIWDFLNLTLEVGKGVLIPRPETELLCEIAVQKLSQTPSATVLDLCAGTGCVGLGIASLKPDVRVTSVEVSEQALYYLNRNLARYPALSVTAQKADVLTDYDIFTEPVDAIVSNPPYISDVDMHTLQREVQHEPRLALAAGDGYRFYRVLAEHWTQRLKPTGFIAVEVGIGQAETVEKLFRDAGLHDICSVNDFAGIPRVVYGLKGDSEINTTIEYTSDSKTTTISGR